MAAAVFVCMLCSTELVTLAENLPPCPAEVQELSKVECCQYTKRGQGDGRDCCSCRLTRVGWMLPSHVLAMTRRSCRNLISDCLSLSPSPSPAWSHFGAALRWSSLSEHFPRCLGARMHLSPTGSYRLTWVMIAGRRLQYRAGVWNGPNGTVHYVHVRDSKQSGQQSRAGQGRAGQAERTSERLLLVARGWELGKRVGRHQRRDGSAYD